MTVTEELSSWAATLRLEDVPSEVRAAACRHLLDGVANAVGSRLGRAVEPALTVAESLGGPAEAAPLGSGVRLSAPAAALANGALVHALDFDDTHAGGLVHATAVVLPAAFAVGEQVGASGSEVLVAALVGYETVCRIAAAVPHGFHARGIHATHATGTIAAAAVTARLLGLDQATTVHALGIAGSASGGLLEFLDTGSSTKQLHPGTASMSGVLASRLAAAGASGPASVLEGRHGVWATLSARPADVASVTAGLGSTWATTALTLKPYPACQLLHVTLDAVTAAVSGERVDPDDIVAVVADVHPDSAEIVCEPATDKVRPRSAYDAKFSLPWSVAALLVDGSVGVDTYSESSISRPEVARLAMRVRTSVVRSAGAAADAPGAVTVHLADGRELSGSVPCSFGGPRAPLTDAALDAKVVGLCGGHAETGAAVAAAVRSLADAVDLGAVHAAALVAVEGSR